MADKVCTSAYKMGAQLIRNFRGRMITGRLCYYKKMSLFAPDLLLLIKNSSVWTAETINQSIRCNSEVIVIAELSLFSFW